jgi:hypothetical protein
MNLQQTIEELDRLVRWGYNRGKIGGKMLEGFQNAITSLNEMNDTDAKESVADSEVSRVVGELQQLRTVARITGLTPKALAYMKDTNDEFMEWCMGLPLKMIPTLKPSFHCAVDLTGYVKLTWIILGGIKL